VFWIKIMPLQIIRLLCLLSLLLSAPLSWGSAYEAPLPEGLKTDPAMCKYLNCADVLPGATLFSDRKGQPPYVEGYAMVNGHKKLLGYVFLSTDITDLPAYSGKPIVTLIGMDVAGKISGVRILKHSEPILLLGIPEQKMIDFVNQYLGKPADATFEVGAGGGDAIRLDAISGATVTVIAENQVISQCAYEVAKQVGLVKAEEKPQATFVDDGKPRSWQQLVSDGVVQHLVVQPKELGEPDQGKPYVDLWFGYLNHPQVGRSVLGDDGYRKLMADLKPTDHALFIIGSGAGSFKGSGFVRGGIYDRLKIAQGRDSFSFRDTDYLNLYTMQAAGGPHFDESGIFIIRSKAFSAAYPFDFVFLGNRQDRSTGTREFVNFPTEYWLPASYLQGGRPHVVKPDPTWLKVWKEKAWQIAVFVVFLAAVAITYANRDKLVRRSSHKDKRWTEYPKYAFWIFSIVFVGFWQMAQPSITHIMTWFHSILFQWKWELFLSDPFIFLFWWFILISVILWGRGLFCGWMCPFGSLSELSYKVAGKLGLKRFQRKLPQALHDKLKWLKYVIFFGLMATSLYSMSLAEKMAEVEPFKTTFLVGIWNRSWPFALFALALLSLGLFIERPFCKYLCPLGAGLALPTTFRFFGLKRKQECGPCKACQVGCGSLAIHPTTGKIDQRECLLCLDCMVLYYDDHACPPLAKERKMRTKNGLQLTPIGKDGYFIPIKQVK
jgi:NosR/NirI family nitrous oxide reductase transcriptional regulator